MKRTDCQQDAAWSLEPGAALLATLLTLATLGFAWLLLRSDPDLYYRSVQEDQALEWASFLAFLVAAVLFGGAAARQRARTGGLPWFLSGVALFCFFVAMEEISWAQRIFAYRPPAYFLENNFQQEFNLHNVVDTGLRKLALQGILLGYGVILPVAALARPVRRLLASLSIVAAPAALAPLFLATLYTYNRYAWDFTGEWVELMMGFGFLFAALPPLGAQHPRRQVVLWWSAVIAAGSLLAVGSEALRAQRPELIEAARAELGALERDFRALDRACQGKSHINKRVYSYVEKYGEDGLYEGTFASLVNQGLPEDRARFFLDPWNSPYWVQCTRDGRRRFYYVYSFGPNRRRDSSEWEVLDDDVGAVFYKRGVD